MKQRILSLIIAFAIAVSIVIPASADAATQTLTLDNSFIAVKPGDFTTLNASLSGIPTTDVSWSIADPGIATVDNNGMVTGVSFGITTVTATASSGLTAACKVHVALKGIDVSKYQKDINWSAVKASGIDFAIIRCGYTGTDSLTPQVDPYFSANYTNALQAGIKVGAYYYSCATNVAMAEQEANKVLSILNGIPLDYPVVYDIEYSGHRTMNSEALADVVSTFLNTMQAAGYKTAVYSSPSIFNSNLSSSRLDVYDRWVAHWGVNMPNFSKPYTMWQCGYGTVPGITTGVVDMDYSYKDYAAVQPTPIPDNGSNNPPVPATTMKCDTSYPYTFGSNTTYIYKITTNLSAPPTASSSNPSAVKVAYYQKTSGGYLYKITNAGSGSAQITTTAPDGTSVFFTASGRSSGVISDTTMPFTMKRNAVYQFKLTPYGVTGVPKITTGNGSVLSVISSQKIGNSYYIKVQAKAKGCTSVYTTISGQSAVRQCMITVV